MPDHDTHAPMGRVAHAATRLAILMCLAAVAAGCSGDDDVSKTEASTGDPQDGDDGRLTGAFVGTHVAGLSFSTTSEDGTTDRDGRFRYREGETVTFAVGELVIGSATGAARITVQDLVPDADDPSDPEVVNRLVLLHTLDRDGDLNNGIEIGPDTAEPLSDYADEIDFDQAPADFAEDPNVLALLAALNRAGVFDDTDPRPRRLRGANAALAYFARATSERRLVETELGDVRGYAAGNDTWQWLGIPYAKPPLGALRWKPPAAPDAWDRPRDAIAWGDQAAQDPVFEASGEGGMSEDCLYLNVTAPEGAEDLPVMVWFHGGAFTILTSNTLGYNNPDSLTHKGVVLVTVNHRLGPFGYLAHPLLVEDSDYGGSGNYGQMDLVMALGWVQRNIKAFGGDPEQVTIFGQSGGCGKVTSLMMSPMAVDLFQRAICQSGTTAVDESATEESVIAEAEAVGQDLFTRLDVDSVDAARALSWVEIIESEVDAMVPRQVYRPTIDHHYMSKTYYETVVDGAPSDVPLLSGATSGDYPWLQTGLQQAAPVRASHAKAKHYVYKFSRVPSGWAKLGVRSGHAGELPYLFNYPDTFVGSYRLGLVTDPASGAKLVIDDLDDDGTSGTDGDADDILASMGWTDDDTHMADMLMDVWTRFAKTGDPSTDALDWPAYTADSDAYVEFGSTEDDSIDVEVKTGLADAFP